jgi:hypothetical protein
MGKRELDELATCVDRYVAKDGNAVVIPAELIRKN